jgi:hypothetical protein
MYNRQLLWHHSGATPLDARGMASRASTGRPWAIESGGDVTMPSFDERRQTVRIATNGHLNVERDTPGPALRLVDVGPGGFSAQSAGMMPLGVVASYRFTTPDRTWSAVFLAKTVYCRPEMRNDQATGTFVSGFSFFDEQPPAVQRDLRVMVELATRLIGVL